MVDNKATTKIENDQLQLQQLQQGDGGDPGPLLLPESSGDLWDTAGMRMSALCLNVLQDISDAVSQYSSEDRTLVRRKKDSTQRKRFADFFRIKKKSKSKKSTESTGDDSTDAKKLQNGQNAAIPFPTDNGSSAKEREKNKSGHGKEMSKKFSFGAIDASGKSATLPSNGKENENISKDQRGKTLSAEEAKSNKLAKVNSSEVTAVGPKQEKGGKRLIRPLKRLETSIQKIVTNVNNKFPATEDAAYERSTKENGLNTSTAKTTEETTVTKDEKRLSNMNNNEEIRDKTRKMTDDQSPVSEGQRQMVTDTKNAPDVIAVSRKSPGTTGRGRAKDRGDQLRRGRSEEALPSKGQVKRVRRRALSREWVVVKTTTTECTTTFSATSKNDELHQSPSNELAMTSQRGSNDDITCQTNDRRQERLLGSERNLENESISLPHRYSNDRPINDFNNNGFLEFPAGDVGEISPPVMSKERIKLSQNNSPTDTLTAHPSFAPEKMSADLNPSQTSHKDPLHENSDASQLMKSVDTTPIVNHLLPQSDLFSLDVDDESVKDFSVPNFSYALNASDANQFTRAHEVPSDAGCTLPITECHFQSTLDDDTTEAKQTQESQLKTEIQHLPSPLSTEIDQIQEFVDRTENPRKEEVDVRLTGNSETVTSGSTKSRWTKRKSAARSRTVEKSLTEDDENSSEGQTTSDLPGLLQSIEARDWKENSIQTKTATFSPKISKPRWTKRKSTARGNRQPDSSLLLTDSHPNAAQPFHSNGVYGCADDGQLCSAGPQNETTENNDCFERNSVECKPRWTKRQLTVRGMSRALVGVNFAPSYETNKGASPSNSRAFKQSPRLKGRRRQDEDFCLNPPVEILHRNLPKFSTNDSILSKTAKRRPLITDTTSASHDIDDVITFSTDAPSFLDSAPPEPSTKRNQRWEDADLDCPAKSIRPKDDCVDAAQCSDGRQRPDAGDDAHPSMAEDKEAAGQNASACKIPIEVECSADSEVEFEQCDDGLDEWDLDITPTNDHLLFSSDEDNQGSSDCETISDRNESKSQDEDLQDDDETSSCFDGSQDGVDSAYFADIDANEGPAYHSPMTVGRSTGLNSDTDPETTDHGTAASDDRHWTSNSANISTSVENTSPSETTSVRESSIPSLEIDERRRDDAMNDEKISVNKMPGCGSDHKESGDAAPMTAFSQRHFSVEHPDQSSTVAHSAVATETRLKTDEQNHDQEMSSAESAKDEHLQACRKEEVDSKSSWALGCHRAAMEKDNSKAKNFNKDGAQLMDTQEKQSLSDDTSVSIQHSESMAPNSADCSAEDALDVKEFSEDERPPTVATASNSARLTSDNVQLMAEGDVTTNNHHQPKTDTEEETDRDKKEAEKKREREYKETEKERDTEDKDTEKEKDREDKETEREGESDNKEAEKEWERESKESERRKDEERRPKFFALDPQRRPHQPRSSTGPTHRMSANRWRIQLEEDGSSPLLPLKQQQRLLHIDVPYSDSGYSETEADTLSPCSFRSSISRADTVTEEGGPNVEDSLTDDDEDDGARFPFFVCSGDSVSLATLDGNKSVFTMHSSGFALEEYIDSAADEVFSPNTKTSAAAAAAAASSGRSDWEWEEKEGREESDKGPSLLSFASYDSGIATSSAVNKDAFEFPEMNLNDDNGSTELVSSSAENKRHKQRLLSENEISSKATTPDSSEMQPTEAPTISEDVIRYIESNVNALSLSPDRHETLRKDIISTVSQQMNRDRTLQQIIPFDGIYSSEIEKEREIITRICDSEFIKHQTVNSAAEVTGRSKENAFCAVTENEFNGEDDQGKQINQSQIPLRNVDSRSQSLANGVSVYSLNHSAKHEFSLRNRGDQSFHEREKTVLDIDRSENDDVCQSPLDSESYAGYKRESHVYVVHGQQQQQQQQQQKPFDHVGCALNEGQTAAINATEVPLKSQSVETKNEGEIYERIHQHETSSLKNVDSVENHDETKISRHLDESEEENQWSNCEVRPLHSEDVSETFTCPTVRDISIDLLMDEEERQESSKRVEQECASKRNETTTFVVWGKTTISPTPALVPAAAAKSEAVTQANISLLRSAAREYASREELDKEDQVLTWHENAEMFSVYGESDEGCEWPRPSAWIWNRSRYTNIHRLSANGDGFFRYPDPLPCHSLSCPLPFTTFCLVRGSQKATSSADDHQVKEAFDHPSFQCTDNKQRSSPEEEKKRRRRRTASAAKEESEKKKEMVMGGSNNKGSEPSARREGEGKALNSKDKRRPETTTPSNDDHRQSEQNSLQLSSYVSTATTTTTTPSNLNENHKTEGSIQRQSNKSENEMESLDSLCSANNDDDEDDAVEAATVDCAHSTETSFDGNQSVGEMKGDSEEAPLEETGGEGGEDRRERVVSAVDPPPVSSSFGSDADGASRQPSRTVVESVGATEDFSVNGRTQQRSRTTNEDKETTTSVISSANDDDDDQTNTDDSNKSTRHNINTNNNTITYFLASTAGLLSIILLILFSVRQTGNVEVNNSKSHP